MKRLKLAATSVGMPDNWHGAIREGEEIVWVCPHVHHGRGEDSESIETALHFLMATAQECATVMLAIVRDPQFATEAMQAHHPAAVAVQEPGPRRQ